MYNDVNYLIDTIKTMLLINLKDTSIYSNFVCLFFFTCLTYIINNDYSYIIIKKIYKRFFKLLFPKYNSLILEGKICIKVTGFITKTDNLFSNRFNAFWHYISKNNLNNDTIYALKEYANSCNIYNDYGEPIYEEENRYSILNNSNSNSSNNDYIRNRDLFIVDQETPFKITNNIYCKVIKNTYDNNDEKKQSQFEMENIKVIIYSYTLSLYELNKFINKIDYNYQLFLKEYRNNKKFIYTLIGSNDSNDREHFNKWEECEFNSTRRFDNLFFEHKKILMNKLDFFINNKDYYDKEGHPYTFGIGLHGPPGTGKTSIIKCIANKLNRHIIIIPLSKIKTQREFSEYFFENYYIKNNTTKIDFEDKIIVFEDIDCMSDIVKQRDIKNDKSDINNKNNKSDKSDKSDIHDINDKNDKNDKSDSDSIEIIDEKEDCVKKTLKMQNKLLNKIAKKVNNEDDETIVVDFEKNNDKITLSFILNIIDGIRETPGRILIISSNNYASLDKALIRPGRIDMTLEMKNASIDIIKEIYNHYYKDILPEEIESKLKNDIISPAKLVNLRLENEKKEDFVMNLLKEFE